MEQPKKNAQTPLAGIRVIELGNFIAGPFLTRILADFGAEVIKVELPGEGDPIRKWGSTVEKGKSIWWTTQSRNKKCITLDMRNDKGQQLARELCKTADVVVENFRPGVLEKWGMGYEQLQQINPRLIMVRISGFGQDGPYRDRAGFGSVGEAMGGLRYVTGYPDRPPTRIGISMGDSVAAMFGALGAVMALFHQVKNGEAEGQLIDVALYESVFALMENSIGEYYKYGINRERTGNTLPKVAPSNAYPTKDGKWLIIAANSDNVFQRLALAMGKPEWNSEPRYCNHDARGEHQEELDQIIGDWALTQGSAELSELLKKHGVPFGPIYTMADIAQDPHYHERGMIQSVEDNQLGEVYMPGIVPKMSGTPGEIKWSGPDLGQHNDEVFRQILGLTEEEYRRLQEDQVI
jgi:crotonobetainyl-CoA:carnitine CoA-transferase CaiB-like acyl-CoA transferase